MNRKMRRANKRGGARTEPKQPGHTVDPALIKAFLDQGWHLCNAGDLEGAIKLAIRIVRLQRTDESKTFFVYCIRNLQYFIGAEEIIDLLALAWREAWGTPRELLGLTKGLLDRDLVVGPAIKKAMAGWPQRHLFLESSRPTELAKIMANPLLLALLNATPIVDLEIERFCTSSRLWLLDLEMQSRGRQDENDLRYCCALARQCYINEYVFDLTSDERDRVQQLHDRVIGELNTRAGPSPTSIALLSAYSKLDCLPEKVLLKRSWPKPIAKLLEEQILGPAAEKKLQTAIPRITPIEHGTSVEVKSHYEENPYPRWETLTPTQPMLVDESFPQMFPFSNFRRLGKGANLDVLIAGCGTGYQSIKIAKNLPEARILAVDLSMSSLCYAKRKSRELGVDNIEYAQADILELGHLDEKFDLISSCGVLHHLAEPEDGWRTLLSLLQPDGCMQIGLYSELARQNVVTAQRFLEERGYTSSAESIRRGRQELIAAMSTDQALKVILQSNDFYSISGCRDLLFHSNERRYTIPMIQDILQRHNLEFLGFIIADETAAKFRAQFSRQQECRLDIWEQFESQHPGTFAGMYEFWVQQKKSY